MSDRYDVIVIGAGPNGLTTGALLARSGRKVGIVERRDQVGGLAAAHPFHDGYRCGGVLNDTSTVRHELLSSLSLERHGLVMDREAPAVTVATGAGEPFVLHYDAKRGAEALGVASARDADRYRGFREFVGRVAGVINALLDEVPPSLASPGARDVIRMLRSGLSLQRLGRRDGAEISRVAAMCIADWLDEWFEDPRLKAAIAEPALRGSFMGPRSPGGAFNLLVYECRQGPRVRGGGPALVEALEKAARAAGAEVLTGVTVREIATHGGRIQGVRTDGDGDLSAPIVAASSDPRHTVLELLDSGAVGEGWASRMQHYRCRGTAAVAHVVLHARATPDGSVFIRTARDMTAMERAFDAVKYRRVSEEPILDVFVPSREAPDCAPKEGETLSVLAHFVPEHIEGGWDTGAKHALFESIVAALDHAMPGVRDAIAAYDILTPTDIAARFGVTGGHVYHGEHALDQLLVRPAPECGRYRTPIGGLYLCGSGAFPGGGLTCAPGALAARAILHDH